LALKVGLALEKLAQVQLAALLQLLVDSAFIRLQVQVNQHLPPIPVEHLSI
jgi:hypothetical protein